jgi:hypothetical protein
VPDTCPRPGQEDPEEVPVRTITDRRQGAAVALLVEVVAALDGYGRPLAFSQAGRGRLQAGEDPVGEGAAGGIGVLAEHGQFHGLLRHPGPRKRRGQVVVVFGMAGRAGSAGGRRRRGCAARCRPSSMHQLAVVGRLHELITHHATALQPTPSVCRSPARPYPHAGGRNHSRQPLRAAAAQQRCSTKPHEPPHVSLDPPPRLVARAVMCYEKGP